MDKDTRTGMALADVLLVVFIVLKLVSVINWSWWWVLSPLWISILIAIVLVFIVYLIERKW